MKVRVTNINNGKLKMEDVDVESLNLKEDNKVKTWIKKHKTVLAVGSTALVGIGFSIVTYRLGYRDGRHEGYRNGIDFYEGEYEMLLQELRDK